MDGIDEAHISIPLTVKLYELNSNTQTHGCDLKEGLKRGNDQMTQSMDYHE